MWRIEFTDQFELWWNTLTEDEQERVTAAVELLEDHGPSLGRPVVDTVKGSRHGNMKELRPRGGHLRILFSFDPRRTAVLLCGGDKRARWSVWYAEALEMADRLYDEHLETIAHERQADERQ